jgi:hypothetical protein
VRVSAVAAPEQLRTAYEKTFPLASSYKVQARAPAACAQVLRAEYARPPAPGPWTALSRFQLPAPGSARSRLLFAPAVQHKQRREAPGAACSLHLA